MFIGILDIFGFEMLEDNSFEQLCINYANETLQGMFDEHVFALEKTGYEAENIDFDLLGLEFRDNKALLTMLNKNPTGIFQLMDEQGALGNRGSDLGFYKAVKQNHEQRRQPGKKVIQRFAGAREGQDGRLYFSVNHFAGIVEYTAIGMVEKNADHLQADLADLIAIGGMPVPEKELSAEEQKLNEVQQRMNKRPKRNSLLRTGSKNSDGPLPPGLEPASPVNSFSFLQMILRLREQKNMGVNEEKSGEKKDVHLYSTVACCC